MARTIAWLLPIGIVLFLFSWLVSGIPGTVMKVLSVALLAVSVVALIAQVRH